MPLLPWDADQGHHSQWDAGDGEVRTGDRDHIDGLTIVTPFGEALPVNDLVPWPRAAANGEETMAHIIHESIFSFQFISGFGAAYFWYRSTVIYEPCPPNYNHFVVNEDDTVATDKQSFWLTRPFQKPVSAELFETLSKQSTMNRWGALLTGLSAVLSALNAI